VVTEGHGIVKRAVLS